jgi:serine/threonine-protein kinase HipA
MSRKKSLVNQLYIFMNGIRVGQLNRDWAGRLQFRYDASWLEYSGARPISLSMPLTNQSYLGDKVENFFDNLLPDNEKIRRRIRARFKARSTHCFDLLAEIGADCVGALQIVQQDTLDLAQKINATPMSDNEIASLLGQYQTAPLGMQPDSDFRISIAGATH